MDEKDSIIAMKDAEIYELKQVIENLKKDKELLQANLDFAMGKTYHSEFIEDKTTQQVLEEDARAQMAKSGLYVNDYPKDANKFL